MSVVSINCDEMDCSQARSRKRQEFHSKYTFNNKALKEQQKQFLRGCDRKRTKKEKKNRKTKKSCQRSDLLVIWKTNSKQDQHIILKILLR